MQYYENTITFIVFNVYNVEIKLHYTSTTQELDQIETQVQLKIIIDIAILNGLCIDLFENKFI